MVQKNYTILCKKSRKFPKGYNMNEEFEKKESKPADQEKKSGEFSGNSSKKKTSTSYKTIALIVALAAFVGLYAVVNISSLSGFASGMISVLNPVIIGFGIAYLLNPVLKFFERKVYKRIKSKRVLRVLAMLSTYLVSAIFLIAVVVLIIPQLVESVIMLVGSFDSYIDNTINLINGLIETYLDTHNTPSINREQLLGFISNLFTTSGNFFESVGTYVMKYGTGLVIGVKNLVFAVFISIYVLLSKESIKAQLVKLATAFMRNEPREKLYKYVGLCNKTFGGFFIGKIIDSLIIGVITLVTLFLFDMPFYVLVSAIVCVTNIIPVFGPFIGAIPSFFIIFIVDPAKALLFLVIILVIQQIDGNIIGPKILGNSTGMSSLGVMIAILVMGEWLGVIGMILGVPIFAVVLAIINELAENKLRKKNLPVNTAEYYSSDSLVDPYEHHESFYHKIFVFAGHIFGKLFGAALKVEGDSENSAEESTTEQTDKEKEKINDEQ